MPAKDPSRLQHQLLDWYQKDHRDLPWRRTKDPYKIWVSEIMLQQTQVATVIPYYKKWLSRFPTLESLARAPQAEVMKHWAGLGYYRRVRMLHEAAKTLCKINEGKIPETAEGLLKLPGVGRYTAGAIASIAFGEKAPVLDGNVIRILTRIYAIPSDIGSSKTIANLWKVSESLLPEKNPGDFNQAMMELGATVCFAESPRCALCPVNRLCRAHAQKRETHFPVRAKKELTQRIRTAALILRSNGSVLIQKQPANGRWGGLWMFPFGKNPKSVAKEIGVDPSGLKRRMTVHHGFTKYRVRLDVYEYLRSHCEEAEGRRSNPEITGSILYLRDCFARLGRARNDGIVCKWVSLNKLPKLAFPSPHQKIARELLDHG